MKRKSKNVISKISDEIDKQYKNAEKMYPSCLVSYLHWRSNMSNTYDTYYAIKTKLTTKGRIFKKFTGTKF